MVFGSLRPWGIVTVPLFLEGVSVDVIVRVVYFISVRFGVLVVALGLIPASYAATYEGQWTKIVLDRVNSSSLDVRATATLSGPDLTPKTYNLPATVSAGRLASLAKGFLRGGIYGLIIQEAMTAAGWIWDQAAKNWYKVVVQQPPSSDNLPSGNCQTPDGTLVRRDSLTFTWGTNLFITYIAPSICGPGVPCASEDHVFVTNCTSGYSHCNAYWPALCFIPVPNTPVATNVPATDQDIFDDGVKPNSDRVIPDIITGLPDVLNTPNSVLDKASNSVKINFPEIVNYLSTLVSSINNYLNIQNIIDAAINDGVESLSPSDLSTLTQNNIDIDTLVQAISNLSDNLTLTPEQQQQINNLSNIYTSTSTGTVVPVADPVVPVQIPTDCDLIPFVCDWLTWFKDWLTEDPPPVPEIAVPIEDLSGFDLWSTNTSGSCPAPYQFSVFGKSVQVSYQPWCDLAILIAPLLMGLAWLFAGYIVLRVR